MMQKKLILGDCLQALKKMKDNSIDAVVTDPPYGLSFMGKKWDYDVPSVDIWAECLRVLKPGGYLLAFAGTRTQHRMAVRIEDAGFEIRDMIAWVYGSGFPKSLDVSKAIDKQAGAEREIVRHKSRPATSGTMSGSSDTRPWIEKSRELGYHEVAGKQPVTEEAKQWEGWGTALKPALEPITVARKPLSEKTVAENVLKWGTGGINIDGSRIGTEDKYNAKGMKSLGVMHDDNWVPKEITQSMHSQGRFPANFIHDGSEEPVSLLGNSARFFYCAKSSKSERNEGLEGMEKKEAPKFSGGDETRPNKNTLRPLMENHHPTVKPIKLMQYLVNLVSTEGATILDPFCGSGSTGVACRNTNRNFVGIEKDESYFEIAKNRI